MAYTTVFSSAGNDLFPTNDDFKNNKLATGLKTLTATSAIPNTNVTIQSIVFSLGTLKLQGYNSSGNGNYFFLTNKELSDYSDYSPALPAGGIDYIEGGSTFLSNSTIRSVVAKTVSGTTINCFRPASSDEYSSVYTYTIENIQGNKANASLFQGNTSIGLNMVGVAGNSGRWKFNYEGNTKWTCTVTWDYTNTKCSPPTSISLDSTIVGKKGKTTLKWSGAKAGRADNVDGNNTIQGYKIFCNGSYLTTVYTTSTSGQTIVEAPETNNGTYIYTIQTIGSKAGFEWSDTSTASAVLKAYWTDITLSSFTCNGKTSPLYIGQSGAILKFNWNAAGGTNNAINKYVLKCDNNIIKEIENTQTLYELSSPYNAGVYTLEAVGKSATTISQGISITIVKGKNSLSISGMTSNTIKQDTVQIAIESLTPAEYNCSAIKYNLGYKQPINNQMVNFFDSFNEIWNSKITLTNKISRGIKFLLYVRVQYIGKDGGYTDVDYKIQNTSNAEYIIVDNHNPAIIENFKDAKSNIIYINDIGYGYGIIELTCAPASQKMSSDDASLAISGAISKHILIASDSATGRQLINKNVIITNESKVVQMDLTSIDAGTKLNVQIQSIDEYDLKNLSDPITIIKFKLPTITSISNQLTTSNENRIKKNNFSIAAKVTPYEMAETILGSMTNVGYSITLKALGQFKNFTLNSSTPNQQGNISGLLENLYCEKGSADALRNALYKEVINNQNPTPAGVITIETWYMGYDNYKSEASINFSFDYFTPLNEINYKLEGYSGNDDIGYYLNPFSPLTITAFENEWYNAAGELNTGASIMTTLYQGNTLIEGNNNVYTYRYNAYNPNDIIKSFKIRQVLSYAGSGATLIKEKEFNVNLAKWNDKETIKIKSIAYTENPKVLSVSLLIPKGNLGSTKYKNGSRQISYSIYNSNNAQNAIVTGSFINELDTSTTEVNFEAFSDTDFEHSTATLYCTLVFTNTNNNRITLTTAAYLLSVADVTLAMRKNKIGINVEKNFGVDTLSLTNTSILTINSLTELDNEISILHVNSPNTPSSENTINLIELSTQNFKSIFSTDGRNLWISSLKINKDNFDGVLPIEKGGTNATTSRQALNNLGAMPSYPSQIELITPINSSHGGYIDFHFNGSTADFTSRIIEDSKGILNLNYGYSVKIGNILNPPIILNDAENSIIFGTFTNPVLYAIIQSLSNTNQLRFVQKNGGDNIWGNCEIFHLPAPDLSRTGAYAYDILTTKSAVKVNEGGTGAATAAAALTNLGAFGALGNAGDFGSDLNRFTQQGAILVSGEVANRPSGTSLYGICWNVFGKAITYIEQHYMDAAVRKRFVRYQVDGTWFAWAQEYDSNFKPTASEIGAVPTTRTVNGKALNSNIVLSVSDIGVVYSSTTPSTGKIWLKPKG